MAVRHEAGALTERLHFQQRDVGNDGWGNPVPAGDWRTQFTVAAGIEALKGGEPVIAARLEGQQPCVIVVRRSRAALAVTTDWRIVDSRDASRVWAITAPPLDPDSGREWLDILATLGGAS